jgi:acyl carrier protein
VTVAAELETFIQAELTQGRGIDAIGPEDELLTLGIVDSHGILELVGFIEERYCIAVADDDLTPENFATITSIEQFIARGTAT